MSRAIRCLPIVLVAVLALALGSGAASAQDAPAADDPTPWASVDVSVHQEPTGEVVTVAGELLRQTQLPARVQLAVPAGSQLRWIGEILGGDPSADPPVTYEMSTSEGSDVYAFTLTQSHIGQIEVVPPSPMITLSGSVYSAAVVWTPSQAVPEARMSVSLPLGAQVTQPAEGALTQAGTSGSYYSKTFTEASAGEPLSLVFAYTAPQGSAPVQSSPASGSGGPSGLILFIAGAGMGAVFMAVRRKIRSDADTGHRAKSNARQAPQRRPDPEPRPNTASSRSRSGVASGLSARTKLMLAAIAVVGGSVAFMIVVNGDVGMVRTTDTGITKVLTSADTDQVLTLPATFQPGGDLQHESGHAFESLEGLPGIGAVTVSSDGSTIEVEYASSEISTGSITAMLQAAGYTVSAQPSGGE